MNSEFLVGCKITCLSICLMYRDPVVAEVAAQTPSFHPWIKSLVAPDRSRAATCSGGYSRALVSSGGEPSLLRRYARHHLGREDFAALLADLSMQSAGFGEPPPPDLISAPQQGCSGHRREQRNRAGDLQAAREQRRPRRADGARRGEGLAGRGGAAGVRPSRRDLPSARRRRPVEHRAAGGVHQDQVRQARHLGEQCSHWWNNHRS
ncbi:hypothetical protein PAHAL_1G324700 [Panicum hallii]|uniref:Uncharacterized protein n=1 Tax=Panicum hallii TaxID=206008 RepID=A0A2T8KX02_9POAL|nr:hypothetical protein PAHAL_1G324700 [Panicum hallii]